MKWTDERIELLKKLHADGLSASKMAAQIGGVSRNAVIGKILRLNLGAIGGGVKLGSGARMHAVKPMTRSARIPKAKPDPKAIADLNKIIDRAPPPVVDRIAAPKSFEMKLTELSDSIRECRWPTGEHAEMKFCGHPVQAEKSWCPYHCRLAFSKGTESERNAVRVLAREAA
jgi:GcrA cell cycle regulator